MDIVLNFLVSLMRRQFRLVAALCFFFAVVLLWNEGFTATNVVITIALTLVVGLFFVLVWFWSAILQSINSKKSGQR